ncbi:MAG: prephenate dehydrogenase/arogenate dehydrogenase family protein [Chloroflexi bacterium]|nr:prephenate dehydrogenase/arogenate dehydrogenase family protein [Chloroflexota bacterium]
MAKPKITIIGMGFVGTSLGLALQKHKTNFEVVGHDKRSDAHNRARKMGAIDKAEWNLISAVSDADLVILALPPGAVIETMDLISTSLKPDCVVTDTASVKQPILEAAEKHLPDNVHFIGGNPIIGRPPLPGRDIELPGSDAASAEVLEGAQYCLVPSVQASPDAVKLMFDLVQTLGATPFVMDATEHDGLQAAVNHLPWLLSSILLETASRSPATQEMRRLISNNFLQVTRPSAFDSAEIRDICLKNQQNLLRWLDETSRSLEKVRATIATGDSETLGKYFNSLQDTRIKWQAPVEDEQVRATSGALEEAGKNRFRSLFFGNRRRS